jgi:hypothetical protein
MASSKDKQINTFNVNYDLGHLLINDTQPFTLPEIGEEDITTRALNNLKGFLDELYKQCSKQKGQEEELRDFDKAQDNIKLPKPLTILPRAKPVPKPKPLSRWERYRLEKGLAPKQKKSRMIWSELANDWVPRWGKGRYVLFNSLVLRNLRMMQIGLLKVGMKERIRLQRRNRKRNLRKQRMRKRR